MNDATAQQLVQAIQALATAAAAPPAAPQLYLLLISLTISLRTKETPLICRLGLEQACSKRVAKLLLPSSLGKLRTFICSWLTSRIALRHADGTLPPMASYPSSSQVQPTTFLMTMEKSTQLRSKPLM